MKTLLETLSSWLVRSGLDSVYGDRLARLAALVGLLALCALALNWMSLRFRPECCGWERTTGTSK